MSFLNNTPTAEVALELSKMQAIQKHIDAATDLGIKVEKALNAAMANGLYYFDVEITDYEEWGLEAVILELREKGYSATETSVRVNPNTPNGPTEITLLHISMKK